MGTTAATTRSGTVPTIPWAHVTATCALILLVLACDLTRPFSFSPSGFYLVPVLYAGWHLRGPLVYLTLGVVTLLVFLLPLGYRGHEFSLGWVAQRGYGVGVAGFLLYLLWLRQRAAEALRRANAELEQRVFARTEQLHAVNLLLNQEVAERKEAELALRQSEHRLRAILDSEPECVKLLAIDGTLRDMNPAGLAMIEADSLHQVVGQPVYPLVAPESRAAFEALTRQVFQGQSGMLEFEIVGLKGSRRWLKTHASPFRDADGAIVALLSVTCDITERKRAEEERQQLEARVLQAQKMESLGVLAGGVAHDFNNLLTSMLGYADLAQSTLPPDAAARPMLREIEKAARRAAELAQQMLAYSGKGRFVIQTLRLDRLVQEMASLLHTVVSRKATLQLRLEPATVEGDATQIRQVVMNLITNASDAFEGQEGAITVRTETLFADEARLRSPYYPAALPAGMYALVVVEDNGCGMSADTLTRLFDPFFTTKFTGRGLGLAAVLGIVRGHRGTICVTSKPGAGTRFEVYLPCAGAVAEAVTTEETDDGGGQGTILVIEDEDGIRKFARQVLERAGFRVLLAEDGGRGLALLARHSRTIALVLLDVTMPCKDGVEVLRALRQAEPHLPVIVMSGFSEQDIAARFAGLSVHDVIQKPFQPRDLVSRANRLLRAPVLAGGFPAPQG